MPVARRFFPSGGRWIMVVVIAALLLIPPVRYQLEAAVSAASRPMLGFGQTISQRFHLGVSVRQLTAENEALRDQVSALTSRLAEAQQKLDISAAVSELTDYIGTVRGRSVIAGVVAYSPDPGIESIVISRGSDDGLKPGMAVVTADGVMIGKVSTTMGRTSTVVLLSDSNSQVAARIQNEARSPGIVGGERGLAIAMNFIPKSDEVKPGQTVVTAGTERLIPPDILIGTVRRTFTQAGELFLRATIVLPVSVNQVRVVAIIIIQS